MKASFYTEQEKTVFEKKTRISLVLGIVFLSLTAIGFALTIILSTYETKILWMVFGCLFCIIAFSLAFLFFAQWKRRANGLGLYKKILADEGEICKGRVLSIKEKPIALAGGLESYPLEVEVGRDQKRVLYLSSDKRGAFNIEVGSIYSFRVSSLYIKEIEDA